MVRVPNVFAPHQVGVQVLGLKQRIIGQFFVPPGAGRLVQCRNGVVAGWYGVAGGYSREAAGYSGAAGGYSGVAAGYSRVAVGYSGAAAG